MVTPRQACSGAVRARIRAGSAPPVVAAGRMRGRLSLAGSLTLANVDWLAAFGILAGLALLLVWTRHRWGHPRLHVRGVAAVWLVAAILALVLLRIALG